jgi:hypothetical protein
MSFQQKDYLKKEALANALVETHFIRGETVVKVRCSLYARSRVF